MSEDRLENRLEEALREIRSEAVDPAAADAATGRVWEKLRHAAPIRGCADFQALIPAYRAGSLPEARALLFQDHMHECVACRKAFQAASAKTVEMPRRASGWMRRPALRWAMAAALSIGVGMTAWTVWNRTGGSGAIVVEAADGRLLRVSGQGSEVLTAGVEVPAGVEIRTAKDSSAMLRLADGSRVEMRERSAVRVAGTRRDMTIRLAGGSVIVQAAKRRSGHLYVAARDCTVAVTGTVFSVNSGLKGSRVSVVEGEVRVRQAAGEQVLRAGDQVTTNPAIAPVEVREEIAWSRNAEQHVALLRELKALEKNLAEVKLPGVRYSSRLIDLLPAGTAVYGSIPNLGEALGQAQEIIRDRVASSPALREWWQQGKGRQEFERVSEKLRALSDYLGDEVVMAAVAGPTGKLGATVFLAEVKRPGIEEFLHKEMGVPSGANIQVKGDLMIFATDRAVMEQVAGGAGGFAGTPFHTRIAEAYRDGTGLLFSADLERIQGAPAAAGRKHGLPFADLTYVTLEQQEKGGQPDTRVEVAFKDAGKGPASWLAAPAAIRALDFFSPDASVVAAGAVKSPAAILDELFSRLQVSDANFKKELDEAEAKLGFKVRDDLAASLGGEFAFGVDGPALPTPSWKLAVEVYNPSRLAWTMGKMVQAANEEATRQGRQGVSLTEEAAGGRTWYRMTLPKGKLGLEANFVFVDGYLLAAANRSLIERAIQNRSAGNTLPQSAAFMALLPQDRHANFSGMFYQNVGSLAGSLAGIVAPRNAEAQKLAEDVKPNLVGVYGERDRIVLAARGNLLSLGMGRLGLADLMGLRPQGTRREKPAYRER